MNKYEKMWEVLKTNIKIQIREHKNPYNNNTVFNDYKQIQLDTLDNVFQMIQGLEEKYNGLKDEEKWII